MRSQPTRPASRGKKPVSPVVALTLIAVAVVVVIGLGVMYLKGTNPQSQMGARPMGGKKPYAWRAKVIEAWEKEVADAKKAGRQPDMRKQPHYGPYGNMNTPWVNGLPVQTGGGGVPQNMPTPAPAGGK